MPTVVLATEVRFVGSTLGSGSGLDDVTGH